MNPSLRERWMPLIHLTALFNLAIAEPLFSVLSKYAELFAYHRAGWLGAIVVTGLFCLGFPCLIILTVKIAESIAERWGVATHRFWLASLTGLLTLQTFKDLHQPPLPGPYLLGLALIVGALAARAYHLFKPLRTYCSFLSIAIIVCPTLFLFFSPVRSVVWPSEKPTNVVSIKSSTPVVFLLFDEMPVTALMDKSHQIDPVRYPRWAALAHQSTWFRNDTTVGWETVNAVPAMLTGRYPDKSKRQLPILKDHPNNLFTLLKGSYDENVLEFVTRLCPDDIASAWHQNQGILQQTGCLISDVGIISLHVMFPADMTSPLPPVFHAGWDFAKAAPREPNRNTPNEDAVLPQQLLRFQAYVNSIHPIKRPTLFFFHSKFPHHPWTFLPSGQQYEIIDGPNDIEGFQIKNIQWGSDRWGVLQAHQRELLQIGLTDKLLGMFIDKLKSADLFDRSLIIVTTDHGASFRPNDYFRKLSPTNPQDILPVPLFLKRPFQRHGVTSDRNVESIDILPTIADVLGIPIPWETDGRSMFDTSRPERDRKIFVDSFEKRTLEFPAHYSAKYKALDEMLSVFGSDTGLASLYRIGPRASMIGKRVQELGKVRPAEAKLELVSPWIYEDVNPEAPVVPARVKGKITFPAGKGSDSALAIAINGVVRATTTSHEAGKNVQEFSAMVSPACYRKGENNVAIYIINGNTGKPSLSVVENHNSLTYALTADGGQERITSSEGRTYRVLKINGVPGEVKMRVVEQTVELRGWVNGTQSKIIPERPVVFVNGRSFSPGWIFNLESKIGALAKTAAKRSVFRFVCLRSMLREPYQSAFRTFVLAKDGTALELPLKD